MELLALGVREGEKNANYARELSAPIIIDIVGSVGRRGTKS